MAKKVIEYWFPIKSVGIEGQKEKTKAIGRIASIHQYHARRPTSATRAIILSSILDFPKEDDEIKDIFNLITKYGLRNLPKLVKYENNQMPIQEAIKRAFIKQGFNWENINAFDPFSGGGSFPLEVQFLGMNTFASDLNPIALLIEKATLEYPKKYSDNLKQHLDFYFHEVQKRLEKRLIPFYRNEENIQNEINFFVWARIIPCPECKLDIPLIKDFVLSKKYKWALIPVIPEKTQGNQIKFNIGWPKIGSGFYSRGKVKCPRCTKTINQEIVMNLVSENLEKHQLCAIYENLSGSESSARGSFRAPSIKEINNANISIKTLIQEINDISQDIDIKFQEKVAAWGVQNYGLNSVLKCFNGRQLVLIKNLIEIITELKPKIKNEIKNVDLEKAILLYLTFGLTRLVDYNSTLTELKSDKSPTAGHTWTRPGLFMKGMPYIEVNPLKTNTTGGWLIYYDTLIRTINNLIIQPKIPNIETDIKQLDAMELDYENESMDFCFTDPPYYDNIPYAASTDYYYGICKCLLKEYYSELFLTESTPKLNELVQDSFRQGNSADAKKFYEKGMAKAFSEIYRVLKNEGIAVIIFAHKDTNAWETLLQAIMDSKLIITNSWPLLMEMSAGIRSSDVISLDSVILLVCRKSDKKSGIKYFDEQFKVELNSKIREKLEQIWRLDFRGADFFLSALGPAFEEFSKYNEILDIKTDQPLKLRVYLDFIDQILVKFSLSKVLNKEQSTTDLFTQFYLVWRSSYKLSKLPYDEVWKFTHALGLEFNLIENRFVRKVKTKSSYVYDLIETQDKNDIYSKNQKMSSLIEALQQISYLWGQSDKTLERMVHEYEIIFGKELWFVAQAICDLTPDANEIKLISGLMKKFGINPLNRSVKKIPLDPNRKGQLSLDKYAQKSEDEENIEEISEEEFEDNEEEE